MPIDLDKVVGAELKPTDFTFTPDDVILYHLGIGAGVPPTSEQALRYCYEGALEVLPTFSVVPAFAMLGQMLSIDGLEFKLRQLLHGEQELVVHRPMPVRGTVRNTGRVSHVYDKGSGALVVLEIETADDDGPIATNRFGSFIRGEGGFGGESGSVATPVAAPEREPDHVLRWTTLPQQALLYRLSGDKNPLHADPAFAATGGFDRPILHGLCTYGAVFREVVDGVLDGDASRATGYATRFAATVLPGETVTTSVWREEDRLLVTAAVEERDAVVLNNATIRLAAS